jgi:hypothetical protein
VDKDTTPMNNSVPESNDNFLTLGQMRDLDQRLDAYAVDKNPGRLASDVIADIRQCLDAGRSSSASPRKHEF